MITYEWNCRTLDTYPTASDSQDPVNTQNDVVFNLKNCKYSYALLEQQPKEVQAKIKSVPTIIVLKDGRPVRQYQANLMLKLNIRQEELQEYINEINGK